MEQMPAKTRASDDAPAPLLSVRNLNVQFRANDSLVHIVRDVSFEVRAGEILALVGESGCGKSVSSLAVMRLLSDPKTTRFTGEARLLGRDYFALPEEDMRRLRGRDIAMIFQEPMTSLNPLLTIGRQIAEPMFEHLRLTASQAQARAIDLLTKVGITDPERRLTQYPHELSGGMRQRVMIAIALACNPKVIIADEPTTALDVTIQAQILDLLQSLVREMNVGLVLITHNLALVARYADRVSVMYAGKIVESGTTRQVLETPRHRYTEGLLAAVPRLDVPRRARLQSIPGQPPSPRNFPQGCAFHPRCPVATEACQSQPALSATDSGQRYACFHPAVAWQATAPAGPALAPADDRVASSLPVLQVRGLAKDFHLKRGGTVRAIQGIDLYVPEGGTLGLVGESGCGKTTVARTLLRLQDASAGTATFRDSNILSASKSELLKLRQKIQVVYQDPFTSLNPRHRIGQTLAEPLLVHGLCADKRAACARVDELLDLVGLPRDIAERYPHQMSGGQRQRVGIARALGMKPELIICDEPVSALDVSIQAQIMNLFADLQKKLGLSYLFIAHDLAVVRHISDVVAVMYLGRVMEIGTRAELFERPRHPYTRALLAAVPSLGDENRKSQAHAVVKGDLPSPLNPPAGCVFHTRCPIATEACRSAIPPAVAFSQTHRVACIKAERP
ncbi:ABC transporter ATP-binding protein [Pararhizobium sp. BT-229]|uniref:ABC transporter ATP-binding protein n=1 Tax=Pararhizobium sp. BT-229 TaxID=2986923 RepID=UPI0021F6E9EA|nr:ABC transporter ATP-binding protein [Pararhizobium sp. BT-229]MCV9967622.1 ABC transporter ATP-binding protein [Pararhizobium sp. BT-229]